MKYLHRKRKKSERIKNQNRELVLSVIRSRLSFVRLNFTWNYVIIIIPLILQAPESFVKIMRLVNKHCVMIWPGGVRNSCHFEEGKGGASSLLCNYSKFDFLVTSPKHPRRHFRFHPNTWSPKLQKLLVRLKLPISD